jgi:curli production assembly/transport component CsgE
MKTIALLLVCCCFCHLNGQEPATDPVDFELDGLIFDQTRTRIGRDFYEDFFTKWAQPDSVSNYSILLEEQPSRGRL